MYYHVWRQLQLIIHFGLPSPPHDNVVHSVPLSLGSHPFSHFHTLDYHKLTETKMFILVQLVETWRGCRMQMEVNNGPEDRGI